jgi:hypothetical protein
MSSQIDLDQELRELGRTLIVAPPPDDLAERVLVRVQTEGPRRGRLSTWWGWLTSSRRRLIAAIVAALLIGPGTHPAGTGRRRGVAAQRRSLDQVRAATGRPIGQPGAHPQFRAGSPA